MRTAILCLLLISSRIALAEDGPVIGRLFAPAGGGQAAEAAASRLRVDGAVARSTGKNTIWLNGQSHTETAKAARTSPAQLPAVALEGKHLVRVGETLNLGSGRRQDLVPETALIKGK